MPECGICIREKTTCLTCPRCKYVSCTVCLKEYFKSQTEPVCPNPDCRIQLTREIISKEASGLLKVYKTMRENYLLDQEKARLPESQVMVEMIRMHEEFARTSVPELQRRQAELNRELLAIERQIETHRTIDRLCLQRDYETAYRYHTASFDTGTQHDKKEEQKDKVKVLCPCPSDKCRGFVIVENKKTGKCGVCDTKVCVKCCVITTVSDERHECKEDDIATVREIRKQSRPCPKCTAPISKISGCDQMWCVVCHTAFSWNTGSIVTGAIHNPHFFAYQRTMANGGEIPRVEGDVVEPRCDGDGNGFAHITNYSRTIIEFSRKTTEPCYDFCDYIKAYIRLSQHFYNTMYPAITGRRPPNNMDMRVSFMKDNLPEKEFARVIQQRDKKYQKELEIDAVHLILFDSGNRIINNRSSDFVVVKTQLEATKTQLESLVKLSNERLEEIGNVYKNKVKTIVYKYDTVSKIHGMDFE